MRCVRTRNFTVPAMPHLRPLVIMSVVSKVMLSPKLVDPKPSSALSENPRHWAYIANLMKKQLEIDTIIFWAGFSDRAEDGFGSTSFGENITLDTTDIITSGLSCGIAGTSTPWLMLLLIREKICVYQKSC